MISTMAITDTAEGNEDDIMLIVGDSFGFIFLFDISGYCLMAAEEDPPECMYQLSMGYWALIYTCILMVYMYLHIHCEMNFVLMSTSTWSKNSDEKKTFSLSDIVKLTLTLTFSDSHLAGSRGQHQLHRIGGETQTVDDRLQWLHCPTLELWWGLYR